MKIRCNICYSNVEPTDFLVAEEEDCYNCAWTCPKCSTTHGMSVHKLALENKVCNYGREIIRTYTQLEEKK